MRIKVIIPSYNNRPWIRRCLDSVMSQDYPNFDVLVVDDASTDGQAMIIQEYPVWWIRNKENWKCPRNLYEYIPEMDPADQDVIFILDGDDCLPGPHVFTRIAEVYEDPDVWLTYGSYAPEPAQDGVQHPPAEMYPPEVIATRSYRTASNVFNHPLTFRYLLWQYVTAEDLHTEEGGGWFEAGYDYAIMMPLLELATPYHGPPHWRFLDEVLYVYNTENPLSEVKRFGQRYDHEQFRQRTSKEPLI